MVTKGSTSRALPEKGKLLGAVARVQIRLTSVHRFGWVNASYVYGLQIVNAHMKRALGACTPYETFQKATELYTAGI